MTLWNSVEEELETFNYDGVWPVSIYFVDLDESCCDGNNIEIIWKYLSEIHGFKHLFPETSTSL